MLCDFLIPQVTVKKVYLSSAQKQTTTTKNQPLISQLFVKSNLTPGTSMERFFTTVMDEAVLAATVPGGDAHQGSGAFGSVESSASMG